MNQQLDPNIYDEEAFIGTEEGEIEGNVVDDLNDEGALLKSESACRAGCSLPCKTLLCRITYYFKVGSRERTLQ